MPASRSVTGPAHPSGRAARGRVVGVLTAGLALAVLPGAAPGAADDLHDRKDDVEDRIEQTEEHLQHSSRELVVAARRLSQAEASLGAARTEHARTRGELFVAQALDRRMQVELDKAVQALSRARAALADGRAGVTESEKALRTIAAQQQTSGGADLMAIATVLTSQDPADLTGQLSSHTSVIEKETATLSRLEAARVLLTVQETAFQEAQEEVARQRAAAADNLALKAELEARAEQEKSRIAELVSARSSARQEAATARADDLQRLERFHAERDQIAAVLKRRAEAARQRAEAAARARARAAARAAERGDGGAAAPAPTAPNSTSDLSYPVDGYITSPYGMRLHPVYKQWRLHDGTDFGAGCGTPIRAAAPGRVIGRYYDGAYGNRVIVDHGWVAGGGLGTTYNHLSSYSTYVGERVSRGEVIGYVGTTGYSTGCHLHFMVFRNGVTVDPMNWL